MDHHIDSKQYGIEFIPHMFYNIKLILETIKASF